MKCSRCSYDNRASAKFCEECAAPLERACGRCGALVSSTAKFCPECAHPVGKAAAASAQFDAPARYTPKHLAERILTSKSALEGERKQVTVLFADLKGSMELLADRDPEEARRILDPVLERMMEAVHRFEGTVNQVMGDGIMALFGAPLALEDHAVRACYAALAMQSAIRRYSDELRGSQGIEIQLRVGLNSGEVVVRSIGSDLHMDYSAIGQTTHLASRMEQLATPGTSRLTADTLRLAEGFVQVAALGRIPVKGLPEPIEIFELTGATATRTRMQAAAARGLTRFVGRQREIEVLNDALASAGQGKGQVVAIVGEPGVGKSRLFWEFSHSHRTQGWLIAESGSVSYGKATPYLPIIDLLKGYFRIAENDDARSIREKVTGKLLTLDRSLESLLTPLLTLLDQSVDDAQWQRLDPPQRRRQTLDALKRLWLREAQAQPLILVFEDLHWIDSETQAFLNGLMDSVPAAKLLLLFNYRPEYHHPWGSKTYYTQLRLDALTTESAQEFLDSLLGMHPSVGPLKQVLIERTEGNPFYLEESVRTSVETHALTGERGAYRLAKSLQEIQVPATVQAVLAARIDRLQPQDKHLLQTAAVLGKDVPYLLLREIADLTEDELRQRLAELQAAEFVYETSLYPDLEYTFRHALTHEVAYGSLLTERRRKLHGRIVQAIENLHAERLGERVDELGHHALRAEEWEKAVEYFRQAGVKAFEQSANRPAAAAFEQALAAIEHLPQTRTVIEQTVDLCLAMRPCVSPLADMKRLLASAQRAAPLLTSLGDARREALNVGYQAAALVNLGRTQEGIALAERAVAIAESLGDPLVRTSAYFFLGQARVRVGSFHKAIESFDRDAGITSDGLIDLSSNPSAGGTLQARSAVTSHLFSRVEGAEARSALGLFASAMDRAQEARRVAQRVGLVYFRAQADAALGLVHQNRGEIDAAISVLERVRDLAEEADSSGALIHAACGLGPAYNLTLRAREAIVLLERACGLADAGGFLHYGTFCLMHLADAYSLTGLPARARESVDRALKLVVDAGFRAREAWALYVRAGILARGSDADPVPVLENYAAALARADELAMRPLVAHCHLGLGSTYTGANDRKKAREHRTTALSMYREMGMQFWMEKAESALKELSAQ